jgi:hypothetical protein
MNPAGSVFDANVGTNPKSQREFIRMADVAIDARMVNIDELVKAECKFGDAECVVQAYRIVNRGTPGNERSSDPADINLGAIIWETSGPESATGTKDDNGLRRWLAGVVMTGSDFVRDWPLSGRAEIELLTSRGWVNAKTGEPGGQVFTKIARA